MFGYLFFIIFVALNLTIMGSYNDGNVSDPNAVSRIAAGMTLVGGEIRTTNDLRIDGSFEGRINSRGRVIIGEGGSVKADIVCSNLDVWGAYEGDAVVKDTLSLRKGSAVKGNFSTGHLSVEIGSVFEGQTKVIKEEEFARLAGE